MQYDIGFEASEMNLGSFSVNRLIAANALLALKKKAVNEARGY